MALDTAPAQHQDLADAIVTVMTATMMGSIDTMAEALDYPVPQTVLVETDQCRMFATRVDPKATLVLITPKTVGEGYLRYSARQILAKLAVAPSIDRSRREELVGEQ